MGHWAVTGWADLSPDVQISHPGSTSFIHSMSTIEKDIKGGVFICHEDVSDCFYEISKSRDI